jgi:pimeloyl-ACP methyl ester carboxylesterase
LPDDVATLAPDRPGYGESPHDPTGFLGNADAAVAELDAQAVEQAVVVGHSWGGGVALALAQRHPERVRGLVLAASVGPQCLGWIDRILAAPLAGEVLSFAGFTAVRRALGAAPARRIAQRLLPSGALDVTSVSVGRRDAWRSFTVEQRLMGLELPELADGLDAITVPTVVLSGEVDRVMPRATARALADAIPGAELVTVPGVGHLLPIDAPQVVAAAAATLARDDASDADEPLSA